MKWSNVRLIFLREVRDQLRDRRTLFTIAVLPLLLYPLIGMTFFQVAQFLKEHEATIWILGAGGLPDDPALLDGQQFAAAFCPPEEARLLKVVVYPELPPGLPEQLGPKGLDGLERTQTILGQYAQQQIDDGHCDAVIYVPADFARKLSAFRAGLRPAAARQQAAQVAEPAKVPQPIVFFNKASDKSRIAYQRLDKILARWQQSIVRRNLEQSRIPPAATEPFQVVDADVAEEVSRRAAVWSKILPFVVLVWALTGAFYPAIDLCAGEKERGTLETLLSSPAERIEIVWGKLLTVMSFSVATALLNLLSMGMTGLFIIGQLEQVGRGAARVQIGPPPLGAVGWLVVACVPVSALFSALSLAVAALARSSKEGQYYLMPLLLFTLPLMMLPMLPAAELDLGTSLIPVSGVMLLLRSLIEGQYVEALRFSIPVIGVTALCCWLAVRWAVSQFNNESVLFAESERWGPRIWLRHLVRDRGPLPTFGEAMLCGVLLLVIRFFASLAIPAPDSWPRLVRTTLTMQIGLIAAPALIMAVMLTRNVRQTLSLRLAPAPVLAASILLAVLLHPAAMALAMAVQNVYPISAEAQQQLESVQRLLAQAPSPLLAVALIALLPAVCEELAFRGFMLSGLRQSGGPWTAILISSLFFGAVHFVLQQSITACAVGLVIGYLVLRSGSLLAGTLFHLTYNSLSLGVSQLTPELIQRHPVLGLVYQPQGDGQLCTYQLPVVLAGLIVSALLLAWFYHRSAPPTVEGQSGMLCAGASDG